MVLWLIFIGVFMAGFVARSLIGPPACQRVHWTPNPAVRVLTAAEVNRTVLELRRAGLHYVAPRVFDQDRD